MPASFPFRYGVIEVDQSSRRPLRCNGTWTVLRTARHSALPAAGPGQGRQYATATFDSCGSGTFFRGFISSFGGVRARQRGRSLEIFCAKRIRIWRSRGRRAFRRRPLTWLAQARIARRTLARPFLVQCGRRNDGWFRYGAVPNHVHDHRLAHRSSQRRAYDGSGVMQDVWLLHIRRSALRLRRMDVARQGGDPRRGSLRGAGWDTGDGRRYARRRGNVLSEVRTPVAGSAPAQCASLSSRRGRGR